MIIKYQGISEQKKDNLKELVIQKLQDRLFI